MMSAEQVGLLRGLLDRYIGAFVRYCEILALAIFFQTAANITESFLVDGIAISLYFVSVGYFGFFVGQESSYWLRKVRVGFLAHWAFRVCLVGFILILGALNVSAVRGAVNEVALTQFR